MAERSFPVQTPLQRLWSAILIRTVRQKQGAIKHLQKAGARMSQQRSIFLSAAHVLTAAAHLSTKAAAVSAAPAGFQSAVNKLGKKFHFTGRRRALTPGHRVMWTF